MERGLSARRTAAWIGLLLAVLAAAGRPAYAHGPQHHGGDSPAGEPGRPDVPARVVRIEMAEPMRFLPDSIRVRRGETIRFVFSNSDYREHEFVIGEMGALQAHAAMMREHPGMQHKEVNAVTVSPWNEAELIWHFGQAGRVDFACLIAGHFEAGMRGAVIVEE
jgi:uncharacterized cupredoxin-like copper-binding protein